jgi:hypothetical protein
MKISFVKFKRTKSIEKIKLIFFKYTRYYHNILWSLFFIFHFDLIEIKFNADNNLLIWI